MLNSYLFLVMIMDSQTTNKNFSTVAGLNMGLFSPEKLKEIVSLINEYEVPMTKITGAQRLALLGMEEDEQKELQEKLAKLTRPVPDNGVTYVQACPGSNWCKYGVMDALSMGEKLEKLSFSTPLPAKVKIGVSGCRMCCTEPYIRDVGLVASTKGWTVVFGGNGGGRPRIGEVVAKNLNEEQALALVEKCLTFYQENAYPQSRTARFMERHGLESLKEAVLSNKE